jgi:hypothetical protein
MFNECRRIKDDGQRCRAAAAANSHPFALTSEIATVPK